MVYPIKEQKNQHQLISWLGPSTWCYISFLKYSDGLPCGLAFDAAWQTFKILVVSSKFSQRCWVLCPLETEWYVFVVVTIFSSVTISFDLDCLRMHGQSSGGMHWTICEWYAPKVLGGFCLLWILSNHRLLLACRL
jgi:hypothetical protein